MESCKKNCEDANKLCGKGCKAQKKANEQQEKTCTESCESAFRSCTGSAEECEQAKKACQNTCEIRKKANEEADKACYNVCESNLKICKRDCRNKNETRSSDKNETDYPESAGCQTSGQSCTLDNGLSGVCLKCKTGTGCKLQCLSQGAECFEPCGG